MTEPSDIRLWRRAAEGDASAFGELFDRHARAVYNFCFRRTADWGLAEDLTSAVFLEAWRRRAEVQPMHDSLRPWLLGVASNILRNAHRSIRHQRAAYERLERADTVPDHADEVAQRLDDEVLMRRTLAVFERLPIEDREVLSLCLWGGLTYAETARALGIPVGTVRSRLSRSRARLRELATGGGHERNSDGAMTALPNPTRSER